MGEASPLRIERKAGSRQAVAPSAWNEDIELTRCAWVCSSPGKSPSRHPDARCYEQGRTSRAVQPAFSRGAVGGGQATAGRERGPRGGASGGGEPVQRWSRPAAPASRSLSRAPAPAARPSRSRRFSPASRPPRGGGGARCDAVDAAICDCGTRGAGARQQAGGRLFGLLPLLAWRANLDVRPAARMMDARARAHCQSLPSVTAGRQAEPVLPLRPGVSRCALGGGHRTVVRRARRKG